MEPPKEPHSVSLKVLRLSRPTLSHQYPLPTPGPNALIKPKAALSIPTANIDEKFVLSPVLNLPPAFGSAYVGEKFCCTLCGNNELPEGSDRTITSLKMIAEMQTPSQTIPLKLAPEDDKTVRSGFGLGDSLQKLIEFELKEEGNYVLAVSLSYSETTISKDERSASSGRARSFRKLYQFIAQPCLSVRTKTSDLPPAITNNGAKTSALKLSRHVLEAQLENMTDGPITLESINLNSKEPFKTTSLNWDVSRPGVDHVQSPILAPRDVLQAAFLIEQQNDDGQGNKPARKEVAKDGRAVLGQLDIHWRSGMGDPGFLTTGSLTSRNR